MIEYVCSSDNNIQNLLISSRLTDPMDCQRRFNVDIMWLYISAMDNVMRLKFST